MYNTPVYCNKNYVENKLDSINIPIIDYSNAIVYTKMDGSYQKTFELKTDIDSGITCHNGNYYYFSHDIVRTPTRGKRRGYDVVSYNIRQITNDIALQVINNIINKFDPNRYFHHWEFVFNNWYYFQSEISYVSASNYGDNLPKIIEMKAELINGNLHIPYNHSPSKYIDGVTIGEFLSSTWKPKNELFCIDKDTLRNIILENIIHGV